MFEMIYHNRIIAKVSWIPIVGDMFMGHTVWEVDYRHMCAYLTD